MTRGWLRNIYTNRQIRCFVAGGCLGHRQPVRGVYSRRVWPLVPDCFNTLSRAHTGSSRSPRLIYTLSVCLAARGNQPDSSQWNFEPLIPNSSFIFYSHCYLPRADEINSSEQENAPTTRRSPLQFSIQKSCHFFSFSENLRIKNCRLVQHRC